MFLYLYTLFFLVFFSLGFIIGKKYQEFFFASSSSSQPEKNNEEINFTNTEILQFPPHPFDTLKFSNQYATIVKAYDVIDGIGITTDRLDIILCKENTELTPEEKQIESIINNNQVYCKIIIATKKK
ncbi:MAG: hypothetical protein WCP97_06905 [bacterium]